MTASYYLPLDVHFCFVDGATIFFDIFNDRYLSLSADQTAWFREIASTQPACGCITPKGRQMAERLESMGLLQVSPIAGKAIAPFACPHPLTSIFECTELSPGDNCAQSLPTFFFSVFSAWFLSKRRTFFDTIRLVAHWSDSSVRAPDLSQEKVIKLARRYLSLTPLFTTTFDACRFRSIALSRFLSLYGVPTKWVFGVRLSPFMAHCWVEYDGIVLNDYLDSTRNYHPIFQT